jgi:hypothetical protein
MKRLKSDWDIIDKAVEEMLNDHMRVWGWYDYFIINDDTILVKVYNDDDEVMFTVKAKLVNGKLEVIDVW